MLYFLILVRYFLRAGFAVIFMYRTKSLEPFLRNIPTSELIESFVSYKTSEGNWGLKGNYFLTYYGKCCILLYTK